MSCARRRLAGLLSALLAATVLVPLAAGTAWAAPTASVISGEIEQLTLNTPGDVWSGGWIRVAGQAVVLPRNLLLDLPANRLSLEQLFAAAPQACLDRAESGLASTDACNVRGVGGFATIQANLTNAGDIIAGDVFIEKGRDIVSGAVNYVNVDAGYFRVNGTTGADAGGTMVRLNDPTGRHTVQQGAGCAAPLARNCSPDPRFTLDADNYTNAFSTGYPMCIPSTVPRPFTDTLDINRNSDVTEQLTAQANADGTGDLLCPDTNRNVLNTAADSRLFAPIQAGDQVTVRGNYDTVGGVKFLSAFSTKIGTALSTNDGVDQPDYMVLDSMFIDAPGFQRLRIRDQFIGATTEADSDVVLWSVHRDPVRNQVHEFPLGSVLGCERVAGPLTCRRVLGPNTFRIRHETLFAAGTAKNPKLSACAQLKADFRFVGPDFVGLDLCPLGGTVNEELGILSPIPHEVQARTGRKMADLARVDGGILKTLDVNAKPATNGQFLFPMGIGLGGIAPPAFAEIDINALGTPTSFDGIPWNLDRRLSPNGCVGTCESTPQPLDPFPYSGFDPRTQAGIIDTSYADPNYTASPLTRVTNRVLSFVDPTLNNFNGDNTVLTWPPIDPPAVGTPPPIPVRGSNPLIVAVTPATGPVNTAVTIDGVGFTGAAAVSFGGVAATGFTVNSDTQINATVPVGAVSGTITIALPSGTVTSATRFTVIPPATVSSVSPVVGLGGTPITVTGTGFSTATSVTVNGAPAAFSVLSDTALRATVPLDATSGPVMVSNPAGTSAATVTFTVTPPPPAPRLTGFAPSNGSVGTTVTIAGTDLLTTVAVYFGGVPAVSFTAGPTLVTAIVPPGALTGSVSVATAGGSGSSSAFFQVTPTTAPPAAPLITSVTPAIGPAGTQVTITGSNLANTSTVTFGGVPAVFQQVAAGLLAVVPTGAISGAVVVTTTLGGPGIAPTAFTVTPAPPPTPAPSITDVTPSSGTPGSVVTVTGANLAGATAITVNGTPAPSFTVLSASTVALLIPTGATTGPILIQAPAGIATSPVNFIVLGTPVTTPPPSITSFTPASGSPGSTVVITGTNLTGATTVTVNGTPAASFTVNSATQLTLVVGAATSTGTISVQTPGGSAVSATSFTVAGTPVITPPPSITSFTPASGSPGSTVVITGANFTGATTVTVNGTPAGKFTVNSATKITLVVGAATSTGTISVQTPAGVALSATNFTVLATPAPSITAITPATGLPGATVVITGKNLTGATAVTVNGTPAGRFTVTSPTKITFVVGTGTSTGTIAVRTPGGTAASAKKFTVPSPKITSFTPVSGNSGTTVVITGNNFTGATAVTVNGTPARTFTVTSATKISFVVGTATTAGLVRVTSPAGTAASAKNFTIKGVAK